MTPDNDHPTFLSGDALEELRKSDPAAFDDDVPAASDEPGDTPPDDRERDENSRLKAKEAGDDKPDGNQPPASGDPPKDGARPDDKPADKVDRREFDGVVGDLQEHRKELRLARQRIAELEEATKKAEAANARDFDAEIKALETQYDEGDVEFVDFQKRHAELVAEKTRAEVLAEVARKEGEKAQQTVQQQYDAARDRFFAAEENKSLANTRAREAAFSAAIDEVFEAGTAKTYDDVFAQAAEIVRRDFPTAKAPEAPADPNARRNAADAAAATKAAGTPPPINGGVGNRASIEGAVDLATLKPGKFSALPKDEQARLLGDESAL